MIRVIFIVLLCVICAIFANSENRYYVVDMAHLPGGNIEDRWERVVDKGGQKRGSKKPNNILHWSSICGDTYRIIQADFTEYEKSWYANKSYITYIEKDNIDNWIKQVQNNYEVEVST